MDHTSTFLLLPQECLIHPYSCSHLSGRAHGVLDQFVALNSRVIIYLFSINTQPIHASVNTPLLHVCTPLWYWRHQACSGSPRNVDQWVQSELAILLLFCSYEICNPMLCTLAHSTSQTVWWSVPNSRSPSDYMILTFPWRPVWYLKGG